MCFKKFQLPNEIVDVSMWQLDQDFGIYPEGKREKNLYQSPSEAGYDFIRPNHKYLFKRSVSRHPVQFWSEILAYRLGVLLGVNVPPAHIAINSVTGEYGALIEWFYMPSSEKYIPGGDFMIRIEKDFDREKGKSHCIKYILGLGHTLAKSKQISSFSYWTSQWAKIITFDAIIGNTDRHQENWGVIFRQRTHRLNKGFIDKIMSWLTKKPKVINWQAELAPAFDNGTSLMYEIKEEKLQTFDAEDKRNSYIKRGTHQMKISPNDLKNSNHFDLVSHFLRLYPLEKKVILNLLGKASGLGEILDQLTEFDINVPFRSQRAEILKKLLKERMKILKEKLEEK